MLVLFFLSVIQICCLLVMANPHNMQKIESCAFFPIFLWVMYYICCLQTLMGKSPVDLFYGLVDENSGGTPQFSRPLGVRGWQWYQSPTQTEPMFQKRNHYFIVLDNTNIVIPLNSIDFPFQIPNRVQCDASALNIQKETVISLSRQFWCREPSLP